jgi:hypothetical protein
MRRRFHLVQGHDVTPFLDLEVTMPGADTKLSSTEQPAFDRWFFLPIVPSASSWVKSLEAARTK